MTNENTPSFAVVGRVNMGKSTVLATLLEIDDDSIIRVSATPGETTGVHILPLTFGGKECVRFLDTPGFTRPIDAMRRIQQLAAPNVPTPADLRRFVDECAQEFPDETRLLAPLLEGAGILYIIDPTKPLIDAFLAEMEILRWTGRPRLALLNPKDPHANEDPAWRDRLGAYFNLTRSFDAHHARYDERQRLLQALLDIDETHAPALRETMERIEQEWLDRIDDSVDIIRDHLEKSLTYQATETMDKRDFLNPERKKRIRDSLTKEYHQTIATMQRDAIQLLLKKYRHHLLHVTTDPNDAITALDLDSAETWSKWGLNRKQLIAASTAAGAATGASVDILTAGHTLLLGVGIGAIIGSASAIFYGHKIPELKLEAKGISLDNTERRMLSVGPPNGANFPWILLDSIIIAHRRILSRAHGRRDREAITNTADHSPCQSLESPDRKTLQKWFISCLKNDPDHGRQPEVNRILTDILS